MTMRRCVGTHWGFQPKISHWLYRAVIRPQIAYGSLVWWPKTQQITVRNRLTSLQRLASLCITGAFKSTPSLALEVLLGLLPLDLFLLGEARMAAYRLHLSNGWAGPILGVGHSSITKKDAGHPFVTMNSDFMATQYQFTKPYSVYLGSREEWRDSSSLSTPSRESHTWYTDGSKTGLRTGYGVYCSEPKVSLSDSLGVYSTVFQTEIFAILRCASHMLERGYSGKTLCILSDSQAALRALDSCEISSGLVWECSRALIKLASLNNVTLKWVPGHSGIEGNECADKLAKEGALKPFLGPEPACGIGKPAVRAALNDWLRNQLLTRWRQFPGQRLGKLLVKAPSLSLSRSLVSLKKDHLRLVVGLITGHGHFRKHLRTVGLFDTEPVCRLCGQALETAEHIVLECEALGTRRRALFGASLMGQTQITGLVGGLLALTKGFQLM